MVAGVIDIAGNFDRDTSARLPNTARTGHTVLVARNYLT
jgi:hypothetical protein